MIADKIFTRGNRAKTKVKFDEVIKIIAKFIADKPDAEYDITIGTDSQNHKYTRMVEVIAVCRVGDGGIFFYKVEDIPRSCRLMYLTGYLTFIFLLAVGVIAVMMIHGG